MSGLFRPKAVGPRLEKAAVKNVRFVMAPTVSALAACPGQASSVSKVFPRLDARRKLARSCSFPAATTAMTFSVVTALFTAMHNWQLPSTHRHPWPLFDHVGRWFQPTLRDI